jgi:hypothetical protein
VALLFVGGSSDLESAEASLTLSVFILLVLLGDVGESGADEHVPYCFSEGDLINGGAVIVEAVPASSEIASM